MSLKEEASWKTSLLGARANSDRSHMLTHVGRPRRIAEAIAVGHRAKAVQ